MIIKWRDGSTVMIDSDTFYIAWWINTNGPPRREAGEADGFLPWIMTIGCTCHPLPGAGYTTYSYDAAITCHGKANKAINTWLNTM